MRISTGSASFPRKLRGRHSRRGEADRSRRRRKRLAIPSAGACHGRRSPYLLPAVRSALPSYLEFRQDRFLRGGDHRSFNQEGFAAVRLTEWRENFNHQHQNVRIENGVQYGDLIGFVDFSYTANVARLNAATLASWRRRPGRRAMCACWLRHWATTRLCPGPLLPERPRAQSTMWCGEKPPRLTGSTLLPARNLAMRRKSGRTEVSFMP